MKYQKRFVQICKKLSKKYEATYENDGSSYQIILPLCDGYHQEKKSGSSASTYKITSSDVRIIFFTYYIDDPSKKRKIAEFTSLEQLPKQKNNSIVVNELLWDLVSIGIQRPLRYDENMARIISDETIIEILVEKKKCIKGNRRSERLLSCRELWDN